MKVVHTALFACLTRTVASSSSSSSSSAAAFLSSPIIGNTSKRCLSSHVSCNIPINPLMTTMQRSVPTSTRRMMTGGFGDDEPSPIKNINKELLQRIINDAVDLGREESGYVIIDVRGEDEIQMTGKLNDVVHTLPLPYVQRGAFTFSEEDFEESFGFPKPAMDETVVLTCKAGIRSKMAAQYASMEGYTDLVNYVGGSDDWFR